MDFCSVGWLELVPASPESVVAETIAVGTATVANIHTDKKGCQCFFLHVFNSFYTFVLKNCNFVYNLIIHNCNKKSSINIWNIILHI